MTFGRYELRMPREIGLDAHASLKLWLACRLDNSHAGMVSNITSCTCAVQCQQKDQLPAAQPSNLEFIFEDHLLRKFYQANACARGGDISNVDILYIDVRSLYSA